MQLSDEQIKAMTKSINELVGQIKNIDLRLMALCQNLGKLSEAVMDTSGKQ
jgi:hypothetical protein